MTEHIVDSPVRIYRSKEHGARLLFVNGAVNPRNILGKMGVDFHNSLAAPSHRVVKARLTVVGEDGQSHAQVFNLNRNSLMKYLQAYRNEGLARTISDADLVAQLNATLADAQHRPELRHAGENNKRPLADNAGDHLRGKFFSWLYQKTIESLRKLRKRFFFASTEKSYFRISEILAKFRFKQAVASVPAYERHVTNDEHFSSTSQKVFNDIPVTTKDNYIKANADNDWQLHNDGKYPAGKKKVDTSTGTTGKPTSWVRSANEVRTVKKSLKVAAQIEYGNRPLNYINAFALGPWATGMTAYEMMRATGSVFASGPDIEKILDRMEAIHHYETQLAQDEIDSFVNSHAARFGDEQDMIRKLVLELLDGKLMDKNYNVNQALVDLRDIPLVNAYRGRLLAFVNKLYSSRSQIIVTGYPPFLKDLVDSANERRIDFSKYHAAGVVGGQAISEALRDALVSSGFAKINSSYGASDCDINIGVETDFEIEFRKKLERNPALARELYGTDKGLPMVFHYDPFNYHIESSHDDELIFTCNRNDRSSPRIRYALGDKGRVYASSDIEALLVKHGIHDLKPKVNFPLLFVWGRDASVAYRGSKVSFTDLERAITNIDVDNKCVKRAFYSYEDGEGQEQFEILVELKEGEVIPALEERQQFLAKMLVNIAELNQDFAYHLNVADNARLPNLRYFTRGYSPISDTNGHRKQVLVFNRNNLPEHYQHPEDAAKMSDTVVMKADLNRLTGAPGSEADNILDVTVERVRIPSGSPQLFHNASVEDLLSIGAVEEVRHNM